MHLITLKQAARHLDVHEATLRSWISKGYVTVYLPPGRRNGARVDLDTLASDVAAIPGRKARPRYGSYGPNAKVRRLGAAQ